MSLTIREHDACIGTQEDTIFFLVYCVMKLVCIITGYISSGIFLTVLNILVEAAIYVYAFLRFHSFHIMHVSYRLCNFRWDHNTFHSIHSIRRWYDGNFSSNAVYNTYQSDISTYMYKRSSLWMRISRYVSTYRIPFFCLPFICNNDYRAYWLTYFAKQYDTSCSGVKQRLLWLLWSGCIVVA